MKTLAISPLPRFFGMTFGEMVLGRRGHENGDLTMEISTLAFLIVSLAFTSWASLQASLGTSYVIVIQNHIVLSLASQSLKSWRAFNLIYMPQNRMDYEDMKLWKIG